eukprot:361046_1
MAQSYSDLLWRFCYNCKTLFVIYALLATCLLGQKYNGPAAESYFHQTFNHSIANLPELFCPATIDDTTGYFEATTDTSPVNYYTLNITSETKQKYNAISISTCCEFYFCQDYAKASSGLSNLSYNECNEYIWEFYNESYNLHCSQSSLDTNLYVLYEKKKQINLIQRSDDSNCNNMDKSYIDLHNYKEGVYIVAVGGYAQEYGYYFIHLQCDEIQVMQPAVYSFPILKTQFNVSNNYQTLTCGQILSNQSNTNDKRVSYYKLEYLTFGGTFFSQFYVTTCPEVDIIRQPEYDTYMYVIQEHVGNILVLDQKDSASCNDQSSEITIETDSLKNHDIYVVVQGYNNMVGNFSIHMECQGPSPRLMKEYMVIFVFGTFAIVACIVCIYYCRIWRNYIKNKSKIISISVPGSVQLSGINITTAEHDTQRVTLIVDSDNESETIEENEELKTETNVIMKEQELNWEGHRFDWNTPILDQLDEYKKIEDVIQLVVSHALKCACDQSGLDIYQMLALAYYDKSMRRVRSVRPFKMIGVNVEVLELSPFVQTLVSAMVVGLVQTIGISVVAFQQLSRVSEYDGCIMDLERWNQVYSLKFLCFMLALMITLMNKLYMSGIQHNGLYQMMNILSFKHIEMVPNILLSGLYVGQLANFYACFVAVICSYFLILLSGQGEENLDGSIEYSAVDLILNAVALFFVLDLDNAIITEKDYAECEHMLQQILNEYKPKKEINEYYDEKNWNCWGQIDQKKENRNVLDFRCCCQVASLMSLRFFAMLIKVFGYSVGLIMPFYIFLCW